ncbi:MAG: NusG domain II-containing protein [Firmicutes bacterium]|nr:NusG domain II-containing protein [Bacillota bacterium]
MKQSRYFRPGDLIIYIALLSIFALGVAIAAGDQHSASSTAVVTLDGREVHRVNLDTVAKPYEFRVETPQGGYNLIRVEQGRIRVLEASCPDKIDVKQGWIGRANQSIVCLPNRLVIRVLRDGPASESTIDGLAF